ncbi:DUF5686 family protein [Pedobacter lusitanus]|nr:DUF5686 family protein [Pedobacter lusitanus]
MIQVKGLITDKSTGQPVHGVTIGFEHTAIKTSSDAKGTFSIASKDKVKHINFYGIGYHRVRMEVPSGHTHQLNIQLEPQTQDLSEVSISVAHKPRYKNKNNPAVELIRRVIEHKKTNASNLQNYLSYKEYEKLNISLSMTTEKAKTSRLLKKLSFLKDNSDSLTRPGRLLTPIFMKEKLTHNLVYQNPFKQESAVLAENQSRIDQFIDEDGINEYLDKIYQRADIYQNDIGIGNQSFMSPIAELAPQFYKYFIIDTLKDVSPMQIKLMIAPRNKEDVLFLGHLYISLDGKYAVQKATLSVNSKININWVKDMSISLDYHQDKTGHYYLGKSVMAMDLGLFKEGASVFGERTLFINDFVSSPTALNQTLKLKPLDNLARPIPMEELRPEKLTSIEQMAYKNIDSLKNSKKFKRAMGVASFLLSGYIGQGKVEVGPFNSFYSFNPVEGLRLKIGGRTTDAFSRRIFFDGHMAYGTRDHKWKYSLGAILSLSPGSIYEFPVKSLTLRHSYETQIPGQDLNFLEDDNFLLSFKRGINDKWLYNRKWLFEYLHETKDHFSFKVAYKNQILDPAGGLRFIALSTAGPVDVQDITNSEFTAEVRWAPHEQFYQGKRFRRPIRNGYPIFTLRGSVGIKGFLHGDYNYQNLTFNVFKRTYLSQFGYSDIILEAGKVFGKVPFPLLTIHRANQSYAYELPSYNLMNFMEFLSDKYASVNLEHNFNGFFLNKIPLVKRLQLREIITFKALTGSISSKNDPTQNSDLYQFPQDKHGRIMSSALGSTPYMEGSIGISNIFKILRIDLVKRLSYLDNPHISRWGIRAKIKVDF